MPRVNKDDPELVAIVARREAAYKRICALHRELQNPMDESRKVELRKQDREAAAEFTRAFDEERRFYYDRGDFSIPVPE